MAQNKQNSVVVKREWTDIVIEVVRFFIQHSTIEISGEERKVSVKYNGPNGYKLSLDAKADNYVDSE
ncbi:hypothetical protein SAMN05216351_10435 [Pseudobutyrivibrio sp. JW11]|uniref:hypothetical protein n=1 Tax=Pseudobutyrivibrio sp. JW11 TaxID=1855302 RepID=UPI0008E65D85|nr:hypothetical protein [Pseudobutyrivibrio sp. JW11]SFO17406.1 hypothetical protein SAMN05216351_10435 [Pseudobutyrivibrio sp. JW11]